MIAKGLKGVIVAKTKLSHIDGSNGVLQYRGIPVETLAENYSFEEIAYFLWYGKLPEKVELGIFKQKMIKFRKIPHYVKEVINSLPEEMEMMDVLRTAISSLQSKANCSQPTIEQAIQVTSIIPSIIAYRFRQLNNQIEVASNDKFNHVKNILYMLHGVEPSEDHVKALETYMILTMEHGMNASTFAARVTISTESDLISGITSAIGTMKGPLHGGAPSGIIKLLNEISDNLNIEPILRKKLNAGERLMGFGHRIYKTVDPRAIALKNKLVAMNTNDEWFQLALQLEEVAVKLLAEYKPNRKLYTNVEFYAAAIMKAINLKKELFTPIFTASRSVGWSAHILEQCKDNTIYRPESIYVP